MPMVCDDALSLVSISYAVVSVWQQVETTLSLKAHEDEDGKRGYDEAFLLLSRCNTKY